MPVPVDNLFIRHASRRFKLEIMHRSCAMYTVAVPLHSLASTYVYVIIADVALERKRFKINEDTGTGQPVTVLSADDSEPDRSTLHLLHAYRTFT